MLSVSIVDFPYHRFVRIHAPWPLLCRLAEQSRTKSQQFISASSSTLNNNGTILPDVISRLWSFSDAERQLLHQAASPTPVMLDACHCSERPTPLQPGDESARLRLVHTLLQRTPCDSQDGRRRGLRLLLRRGVYCAAYPLHDGTIDTAPTIGSTLSRRQVLRTTWASFARALHPQPLDLVRAYLGEQVAFYFAWLGLYTRALVFPALVGLACFVYGLLALPASALHQELCAADRAPGNLTMCPVCRYCLTYLYNYQGLSFCFLFKKI